MIFTFPATVQQRCAPVLAGRVRAGVRDVNDLHGVCSVVATIERYGEARLAMGIGVVVVVVVMMVNVMNRVMVVVSVMMLRVVAVLDRVIMNFMVV